MKEQNPIWSNPSEFIRDHYRDDRESEEAMKKLTFEDLFVIAESAKKEGDRELLRGLVFDVLSSAKNYNEARERTRKIRGGEEEITSSKIRKIVHERLLDSLNILERNCERLGVNSSWRKKIGEERGEIGDWAVEAQGEHKEH